MSTTSLMTFAEFELLPEVEGKRELLEGKVTIMPPPELAHSWIAKQILILFLARLQKSRVWPDHTGYRIAQGWIEPDVSVSWTDQRRDEKYFVGSPMIAVEILSPEEEINHKLTLYSAEGALEVWVIDAKRKAMTVYSRHNDQVIRHVVDREYRSEAARATFPWLRSSNRRRRADTVRVFHDLESRSDPDRENKRYPARKGSHNNATGGQPVPSRCAGGRFRRQTSVTTFMSAILCSPKM